MRINNKIFLIPIFIVLTQTFSFAQDTMQVKYRITILPSQFLFYDFPLTIERVYNRTSLGVIISYRPSTQNGGEISGGHGLFGYYLDNNFQNKLYNSYTVGFNTKYFLNKIKTFFLEGELFYRYWWFDNKNCYYPNVEGYRFDATRTERQNVYGFKLLLGNSMQLKTKSKVKPILDVYVGVGFRYKTYVFETYNGTINNIYYSYKKETGDNWGDAHQRVSLGMPFSIQCGIKIGIGK